MALAHPKRTEILGYLRQGLGASGEGADEAELGIFLGLAGPKVKYHLAVLRDADLISPAGDFEPNAPARYVAVVPAGK